MSFRFASKHIRPLIGKDVPRARVDIGDMARVILGGHPWEGGTILVAGEPGCGKSTMLLTMLLTCPLRSLYVATEESGEDVSERARRLKFTSSKASLTEEKGVYSIADMFAGNRVVILDSLNETEIEDTSPMVASAKVFIKAARKARAPLFLVAHINSDGDVSGPKKVEHLVDAVLMITKTPDEIRHLTLRKNRMGKAGPVGSYIMTETGINYTPEPS